MKLTTILKTAAFATATMLFLGCSDTDDTAAEEGTGVIQFAVLGEDIPYQNLEFAGSLKSAKIDYAYMMIKNPALAPNHDKATRHATKASLDSVWAVDLMAEDPNNRVPVTLGYLEVETGYYDNYPEIILPSPTALDNAIDKGGLAQLKERNMSFVFGGSFVCAEGKTYKYEVQEPLPNLTVTIIPIPGYKDNAGQVATGTPLYVSKDDTLLASFHPHIDHALEVLDNNSFDYTTFATDTNGVIIINDEINHKVANELEDTVKVYTEMVHHIADSTHWDVNVLP